MRISDWSSDVCFSDLAWPDDQLPPARLAGDRVRFGGELVAGQGMADEDRIRLVRVQPAIGLVRDRERPEFRAAIELQLLRRAEHDGTARQAQGGLAGRGLHGDRKSVV